MRFASLRLTCALYAVAMVGCGPVSDPADPTEAGEPVGTTSEMLVGDGLPCTADSQCYSGICNASLKICLSKAANGVGCARDKECISNVCNTNLHFCAFKAANGIGCNRDVEC